LREVCGSDPEPQPFSNPDAVGELRFRDQATLVIEVSGDLADQEPFRSLGGRITQDDFSTIIQFIRLQNRAAFGENADRPH
jgi:hypothetical protein